MALYIFHLGRADGVSPVFEAFELESDDEVLRRTKAVLDQHASCDHVTVWQGDDFVMRLDRWASVLPFKRRNPVALRRPPS